MRSRPGCHLIICDICSRRSNTISDLFNEVLRMFSSMLADIRDVRDAHSITGGGNHYAYVLEQNDIQQTPQLSSRIPVTAISISGKEWRFPPEIQVDPTLQEAAGGSELLSRLLIRRGMRT